MLNTPREVIGTLEDAITLFSTGNSALNREKAKLMVFASKCALQSMAIEICQRRFLNETAGAIDAFAIPKIKGRNEHHKRIKN